MTRTPTQAVLCHIRGMVAAQHTGQLSDGELLAHFATTREEAAFAALVRRHGPLVLGVCRRVLHNRHDAEDAFQAAFLALARHAAAVGRRGSVGGWLHRVAYHAAVRARGRTLRRQEQELLAEPPAAADPLAELSGRELLALLDEELQRLPDEYREPLVLCYLQGKTRDEAARESGCSLGTVKRRIDRGRALLRARLTRRGLALPAVLLTAALASEAEAAVPAALVATTVRSALLKGATPAAVAGLAQGALPGAAMSKIKIAIILFLAVGVVALGAGALAPPRAATPPAGIADEPAPSAEAPKPAEKPAPPALPVPPVPGETKEMTVTGRVLGPDGKPVAGAQMAVVAWQTLYFSSFEMAASSRNWILGRTRADADGKFRLSVRRPSPQGWTKLRLLAAGDGLGLAWKWFDMKADSADLEMHLPAEQVVRGRIVDLQGEPVAGARVHVTELTHKPAKGEKNEGGLGVPAEGWPVGPVTATVNARGDFTVRGLGANVSVEMEVRDDRVELRTFTIETADKKAAENVKLALPPARIVEGRVIYEDTGKPVAGARLMVVTAGGGDVTGLTDKEGRYRINVRPPGAQFPESGNELGVHVYPPAGEPYWMTIQGVGWVKGAARQEANVKLPRGVLVRGKVTEAGSGKPVAGAYVEYNGQWMHRGVSADGGSYAFAVPAGATGPLTVNGPTPDFIPQVIGSAETLSDLKGGDRIYYHAVVPLGLKPGDKDKELPVVLRRGVTMKGRVVGPDGKPVKHALLFVGEYRPPHEKFLHPVLARDGNFELPGCDPDRSYRLVVVDHAWLTPVMGVEALNTYGQLWLNQLLGAHIKLGATVEVSAKKAAAEPVDVRLAPSGSVKLRFVDGDGKPLARFKPGLQLVVTPGIPVGQAIKEGKLAAEVVTLISQYQDDAEPHAGEDGVLKLDGLIPGATYRVRKAEYDTPALKDFTAEAGKTVELTVTVK
jgi:RNA polymerase sigma factor (sigma-70 family)